jgi:hypothetical protein
MSGFDRLVRSDSASSRATCSGEATPLRRQAGGASLRVRG